MSTSKKSDMRPSTVRRERRYTAEHIASMALRRGANALAPAPGGSVAVVLAPHSLIG
jgi:hypothetical protein